MQPKNTGLKSFLDQGHINNIVKSDINVEMSFAQQQLSISPKFRTMHGADKEGRDKDTEHIGS